MHVKIIKRQEYSGHSLYNNPETGLPHIYDHDVNEAEVEDVLLNPGENRVGRGQSRVVIGQTQAGRYLQVVYVQDRRPKIVFVITAYELTGKPLRAYRRQRRIRR